MRTFSKADVTAYAEKRDTDRKGSFYDKFEDPSKTGRFRYIIVYVIGIVVCCLALVFPDRLRFVTWELSITIELSLIAIAFTTYALSFSFVKERYYGISVLDYVLTLRTGSVSSRVNMSIAVICFVLTFLSAWFNISRLFFVFMTICAASVIDFLLALLTLFSGTGKLHNAIRTYVLEEKIGKACSRHKGVPEYISDLFEDAARNNLQKNVSLLEDDLYAIRCFYGVFSVELHNLPPESFDTLSMLHSNTNQLLNLLARSGDYKHALILSRRCMSRLLANQFGDDMTHCSSISSQHAQQFDFYLALQNVFVLLRSTNVFRDRLYDLIRDNLFVYAMTMEQCAQHGIDAFSSQQFDQLFQQATRAISDNSAMTSDERKETLFSTFYLSKELLQSNYQRQDGQNRNDYFYDFRRNHSKFF